MPIFKQHDRSDCGVACLSYIAFHYKLHLSVSRLRQLAGTNKSGTSAYGIVEAARQYGFEAKGVKGDEEMLKTLPRPAIVHCIVDNKVNHFVVFISWNRKMARIMDPASGRIENWKCSRFLEAWTGVAIILAPGSSFQPGKHKKNTVGRMISLIKPHKTLMLQSFIAIIMANILGLISTVFIQKILDRTIPDNNPQMLNLVCGAMFVLLTFRLIMGIFQTMINVHVSQQIDVTLVLSYYRHLSRVGQTFFDSMRIGEITSRTRDATAIRDFLQYSLIEFLFNPIIFVFGLCAMFFYSWKMALASLAIVPFNFIFYFVVDRINKTFQRKIIEYRAESNAQIVEALHTQSVTRRFCIEEMAHLKIENKVVRLMKTTWRLSMIRLSYSTVAGFVTGIYSIGLLWLGVSLVLGSEITIGQMMACSALVGYVTGPLRSMIGLNADVRQMLIAVERLFDIMDLEPEKNDGKLELSRESNTNISFKNVSFKYPGRPLALENVSFNAEHGRLTVLAGPSGCGKSTILSLLQRLYEPTEGRIFIGEYDLNYYSLENLRLNIGVVPQHTVLLSGPLVENLAVGDYTPDMKRLLKICEDVGILETIEKLPQGFATHLTENGSNMSGGQRQRFAMVRALYRNCPILLLDEPSSAIDKESETMLMETLSLLKKQGVTIIMAAHNQRLISFADKVIKMEAGRIVNESGKP